MADEIFCAYFTSQPKDPKAICKKLDYHYYYFNITVGEIEVQKSKVPSLTESREQLIRWLGTELRFPPS